MEMSNVILVCFFRNLANLKTFWSNDNPDRRFFGCKNVENGGKFYNLFLEYADKGSLVDHLQQNGGKLMESNVKRFARSMLKGLNFFHSQGFVHCDIKLQNVLLFGNGDVKIADFGLAKRKGEK
ncbi:hypothetical protein Goshw_000632 [Gossypium schwendimanii]|uniref:Protein kinase domain-containing protein n=1 Tax=Gossypium schwendimanii TaxID=34291 RepID=A0A7J9LZT0_GOSSC|nr:hypothetical protein [Gossypium schwendimanii]